MDTLLRHIAACNNAVLPGGRRRLLVAGQQAGWLEPGTADAVLAQGGRAEEDDVAVEAGQLHVVARRLADAGHFRWRNEAFDVRGAPGGAVLAQLDRGALPAFGVEAEGVHVNGLVQRGGAWQVWVARRAADKLLDPGKLDHIVAGGISAGMTPDETVVKEADEEAAIPAALARTARHVGVVCYAMQRAEGLRRDRLHCYDLVLPPGFTPQPRDGEVAGFELWALPDVLDRVRRTDEFKFNVNLVLIDLFLRHGLIPEGEAMRVRGAMGTT